MSIFRKTMAHALDLPFRLRNQFNGTTIVGEGACLQWRFIRGAAGNRLSIGAKSIIHANIIFEAQGGEVTIGERTYIGRSNLICLRRLTVGSDVIMSWGITVVDHDSHSMIWQYRQSDVCDWRIGRKAWEHVATAPVRIDDKVWIGFNVNILKGVSIGEGAVIGAGSVVVSDIPPYMLAVGNPARVVRPVSQ